MLKHIHKYFDQIMNVKLFQLRFPTVLDRAPLRDWKCKESLPAFRKYGCLSMFYHVLWYLPLTIFDDFQHSSIILPVTHIYNACFLNIHLKKKNLILNLICTLILLSLGQYNCWRTIFSRGYHPPSSQFVRIDMVYYWKSQFLNNVIMIKTKVPLP